MAYADLTPDHSVRRWVHALVMQRFSENYIVHADVYTQTDEKWNRATVINISLIRKLVRGQKTRPPITYKLTYENPKDPEAVANKVIAALSLMEQDNDA